MDYYVLFVTMIVLISFLFSLLSIFHVFLLFDSINYGEITDFVIMMNKMSGRPQRFGFFTFDDPTVADKVLEEEHDIDGRAVRALFLMNYYITFRCSIDGDQNHLL